MPVTVDASHMIPEASSRIGTGRVGSRRAEGVGLLGGEAHFDDGVVKVLLEQPEHLEHEIQHLFVDGAPLDAGVAGVVRAGHLFSLSL